MVVEALHRSAESFRRGVWQDSVSLGSKSQRRYVMNQTAISLLEATGTLLGDKDRKQLDASGGIGNTSNPPSPTNQQIAVTSGLLNVAERRAKLPGRQRSHSVAWESVLSHHFGHEQGARNLRPWNSDPGTLHYDKKPRTGSENQDENVEAAPFRDRCHTLDSEQTGSSSGFRPRNQSILKKYTRNKFQRRAISERHCMFKEEVDVYYFDSMTGGVRMPGKAGLQTETRKVGIDLSEPSSPVKEIPTNGLQKIPSDSRVQEMASETGRLCSKDVDVVSYLDANGEYKLTVKVTATPSGNCAKDRTCVKATSGGSAIIIILCEVGQRQDGGVVLTDRFERIPLPVRVDPLKVRARIHSDGRVDVIAPALELRR